MDSSVPKAIPTSVAPSTGNTVPVSTDPTRLARVTAQGGTQNPVIPKTETEGNPLPQPGYGEVFGKGAISYSGDSGDTAPSVPGMNGVLFRKSPADPHYMSENAGNLGPDMVNQGNPSAYDKVNNPDVQGRFNWFKTFANNIGLGVQNRDNAGWNVRAPQQRTSVWRPLMPQHGPGFGAFWYVPKQLPQTPRWNRDIPIIGTDAYGDPMPSSRFDSYGKGVLNSNTFGAGQTAGGIGGNRFTPPPGPPDTTSTADQASNPSGMPSWG